MHSTNRSERCRCHGLLPSETRSYRVPNGVVSLCVSKETAKREGCFSVNDRFFGFFLTNQTFRHQHHNSATNSSLLSSYSKPMCVRHAETSCGNQASILGNREQKNAGCDCLVVGWRVWVSLLGMLPAEEWCWVFHLLCGLWS